MEVKWILMCSHILQNIFSRVQADRTEACDDNYNMTEDNYAELPEVR